jgi:hypothetical protein
MPDELRSVMAEKNGTAYENIIYEYINTQA